MFNKTLIKMKPVVLSLAAIVLLLISLVNHRQECNALTRKTHSTSTVNLYPCNEYYTDNVTNEVGYITPVSFSGKQFNFFLITF
jgi:hypothetical protein